MNAFFGFKDALFFVNESTREVYRMTAGAVEKVERLPDGALPAMPLLIHPDFKSASCPHCAATIRHVTLEPKQ